MTIKLFAKKHGYKPSIYTYANRNEGVDDYNQILFIREQSFSSLQSEYTYNDFLQAAIDLVGKKHAVEIANEAYESKDFNIFAIHNAYATVQERIELHEADGYEVSAPTYSIQEGKICVEYDVSDSDGKQYKFIHIGV